MRPWLIAELREALESGLGKPLLDSFVAVRKWEAESAQGKSAEEIAGQLFRRY